MKELFHDINKSEKTEIVALKPIEKKHKLIGRMKPQRGQKVFEINCTEGTVNEAEFLEEAYSYIDAISGNLSNGVRKKILSKDNCMYIVALNKKNALKKFFNELRKAKLHVKS